MENVNIEEMIPFSFQDDEKNVMQKILSKCKMSVDTICSFTYYFVPDSFRNIIINKKRLHFQFWYPGLDYMPVLYDACQLIHINDVDIEQTVKDKVFSHFCPYFNFNFGNKDDNYYFVIRQKQSWIDYHVYYYENAQAIYKFLQKYRHQMSCIPEQIYLWQYSINFFHITKCSKHLLYIGNIGVNLDHLINHHKIEIFVKTTFKSLIDLFLKRYILCSISLCSIRVNVVDNNITFLDWSSCHKIESNTIQLTHQHLMSNWRLQPNAVVEKLISSKNNNDSVQIDPFYPIDVIFNDLLHHGWLDQNYDMHEVVELRKSILQSTHIPSWLSQLWQERCQCSSLSDFKFT